MGGSGEETTLVWEIGEKIENVPESSAFSLSESCDRSIMDGGGVVGEARLIGGVNSPLGDFSMAIPTDFLRGKVPNGSVPTVKNEPSLK